MEKDESIYYFPFVTEEDTLTNLIRQAHSSFIETMNNSSNRALVANQLLKNKPISWFGSWYLIRGVPRYGYGDEIHEQDLMKILSPLKQISGPVTWTLAITKGLDYAHYTSYILVPNNSLYDLYTFDSGYGIYRGGERMTDLVIYNLRRILLGPLQIHNETVRTIPPDEDGITDPWDPVCARTGSMQCTGDPFCQTWSILFIYLVAKTGNLDFTNEWGRLTPDQRLNTIRQFILDLLITFPKIRMIANDQMKQRYPKRDIDIYVLLSKEYHLIGKEIRN